MHSEIQQITTQKGYSITAHFHLPESTAKAAIIIAPAMAVSQKNYYALASWLAEQGFLVTTFDYYGMGLSRNSHLRDIEVSIEDWAKFDCSAIIDAVLDKAPEQPLYWLGHSVGSQLIGLIPNREHISRIVTIASGSGYWRDNTPSLKKRVWLLWFFVAPLTLKLCGYFPGKRFNMVGDLPKGVMQQWRRWCLHPEYVVGAEGDEIRKQYASVTAPITSLSFTDDQFMTAKSIESLHDLYTAAPKTMVRISPAEIEARHIGHFAFFNEQFQNSLWKQHLIPALL